MKNSELMQQMLDRDMTDAGAECADLVRKMEERGILVTIEPTRDPIKPGYKHIITAQASRARWEAIEAQKDTEK